MPADETETPVASTDETDDEETTLKANKPSIAELQDEIAGLKKSIRDLLDMAKTGASTAIATECQPSAIETMPKNVSNAVIESAADTYEDLLMPSKTNLPFTTTAHHCAIRPSEYNLSYKNYMPFSAPQICHQPTSFPIATAHAYAPATTSVKYTLPHPFVSTTTVPYNIEDTSITTPLSNMQPSPEFLQHRSTSTYTTAQPRMVTQTYLPECSTSAPLNLHHLEPAGNYQPLRKLHDLPIFSGQPEQWPMFIVAYIETTRNYKYTNLENLIRLQKSLKGDARAKIESFLIHPDSVNQVVSTLEFHYGRPQVLIRSQISKVRAFPPIHEKRMAEIVNFSTMVSNLSAFLTNANAKAHLCNPTLLDELVNKLPLHKREEWARHSVTNLGMYPSVTDFSLWLQEVATYISISLEADTFRNDDVYKKRDKINPSFTVLNNDSRITKCLMCQKTHQLYQCEQFKRTPTKERWNFVKNNYLCFYCLRPGHNSMQCKIKRQCGLSKCTKYHNRLLHEENVVNKTIGCEGYKPDFATNSNEEIRREIKENKPENNNRSVNTIVENFVDKETLFKYLPVEVTGPKGTIEIIAFIDEGSKITLLEEGIANMIGLQGSINNLCLGWIDGKTTNEKSKKVNLEISAAVKGSLSFQMRNVYTTTNLKLPAQNMKIEKFKKRFPILNKFTIGNYSNARPKLLIGLPHIRLVRPSEVFNLDKCFALHRTDLGNIIFGSSEDASEATVCRVDVDILSEINRQVSDYFALDNLGVKVTEPLVSHDDKRAETILCSTTVKRGLQYETGLLWKKDIFEFRDSYTMALKRLHNMESKMKGDSSLGQWYRAKIADYVAKSYARKLSPQEAAVRNDRTWYLPHFVVTNANKEHKRRLVFDAAASVNGESFNSRIMTGPAEYQPKSLLSILFCFRQRKVGVCADIEEMFHRVGIRSEDQTAQRFLWRHEQSTDPPDEYVMQVMIFGSASSPCSAQYVKNFNAKKFRDTHPKAYRAIVENHYVDDYVHSFDSVSGAIGVARDVVGIHSQAGFNLRGFLSNSREFLSAMNTEETTCDDLALESLCENEMSMGKILGMRWRLREDSFCFVLKFAKIPEAVLNGARKPTKSEMLGLTMSIFDPIGFLANVVIKSKILLQELWRIKIDWNTPIPDEIYAKWFAWYRSLYEIRNFSVPRCYDCNFSSTESIVELHIFVDASEVAYAAAAYWRLTHNNKVKVVFVTGKSRCAPLKPLTIPRLELQAAVLGVRLKDSIISCHDIKPSNVTFWSDSKTVIKWIHSDCRTYKQFVAHRIAEVLESSGVEQWRWIPGSLNPADDATRPQNFSNSYTTSCWFNGPEFLKDSEENWPKLPDDVNGHECKEEKRPKFVLTVNEVSFISLERYSSFNRLIRVISWLRRAVGIFKSRGLRGQTVPVYGPQLSSKEINEASEYLYKMAQREAFWEEYNQLKLDNTVSKSSRIFKLTPFLGKDDLIRLSGRINNATCVDQITKEPIILPKNHALTRLIVKKYHEDFKHQNHESICAAIRIRFWIPCVRQLVRSAKRNCQLCRNMFAVPKPPLMGQHPEDRLTPFVRPFSYTGLDYAGPFSVSVGRRSEKRWVALFTCLTVRAIHLEVARDLSTDSVIICMRNFTNRRGLPVRIRSDRGTNFVGASKERFAIDENRLMDECAQRGVEWVFNTPANPSAGGAWERMVRSVKRVLAFTLKERAPQVDTFCSLLIEAENLINSRPLTHLPIDSVEDEPLTPNHFLIGCPNTMQTPSVTAKICLKRQWQISQQLRQTFWKRWILEYLPDLARRTKWYQVVEPIKVGDVVVICDDNETRGHWKRGIVEEVFPAADGQVRSALVKTTLGKLKRPASKLAVLDVGGVSPRSTHGGRDVTN